MLNLLPAAQPEEGRFEPRLVESSWRILDRQTGRQMGRARYTVEIQARWAAEAMNAAYALGIRRGRRMGAGERTRAAGS